MKLASINLDWQKQDSKTWTVGVIVGNIAGLLYFAAYPPIAAFIRQLMPISFAGRDASDLIAGIGWLLALVIGPVILPMLAKKYTFFWGVLPMPIFSAWNFCESILEDTSNWRGLFFFLTIMLPISLASLTFISGPVAFFRWKLKKHREEQIILNNYPTESVDQSSTWPPPPES